MVAYARSNLVQAERLLEEAVKGFGGLGSTIGQMQAMSYLAWITIDLRKEHHPGSSPRGPLPWPPRTAT